MNKFTDVLTKVLLIIAVFTLPALAFVALLSLSIENNNENTSSTSTEVYIQKADIIATKVNEYRASKGLPPLATNDLLNQSACRKADDMLTNQYWSHDSPSGISPWFWFEQVGYVFDLAGENLAEGFNTEEETVQAWIKSPAHEANMVKDYTEQGMCVRSGILLGERTQLIVNHFGRQ